MAPLQIARHSPVASLVVGVASVAHREPARAHHKKITRGIQRRAHVIEAIHGFADEASRIEQRVDAVDRRAWFVHPPTSAVDGPLRLHVPHN